jgi:hypothetical protein
MGILDDAIKEHLELKRQHGADRSELEQLEDEAFGPAERPGSEKSAPDSAAEAPTQFMEQPEPVEAEGSSGRRQTRAEIADLQEAPPAEAEASEATPVEPDEPAEEQAPAMEHEAIPEPEPAPPQDTREPEPSTTHSTEERHAIAEQPTEMFDVEEELAATDARAPSEEELVEQEMIEPRLAPVDPLSGLQEAEEDEVGISKEDGVGDADLDDEFWDEKRLSDELDQALEAPIEPEGESERTGTASEPAEAEAVAPQIEPDADTEHHEAVRPEHQDEDVLEETPDFLEEAPEDDQLWFEQKPPKDFDFDD